MVDHKITLEEAVNRTRWEFTLQLASRIVDSLLESYVTKESDLQRANHRIARRSAFFSVGRSLLVRVRMIPSKAAAPTLAVLRILSKEASLGA